MSYIISRNGLLFIGAREALVLVAYPDGNNRWSIGFGHNHDPKYPEGSIIDVATGFALLKGDTLLRGADINRWTKGVKLTQTQFDALLSLYYEYGNNKNGGDAPMIQRICGLIAAGRMTDAQALFLQCDRDPNGNKSAGLFSRRNAELILFKFGNYGAIGSVALWRGDLHMTKPEMYQVTETDLL